MANNPTARIGRHRATCRRTREVARCRGARLINIVLILGAYRLTRRASEPPEIGSSGPCDWSALAERIASAPGAGARRKNKPGFRDFRRSVARCQIPPPKGKGADAGKPCSVERSQPATRSIPLTTFGHKSPKPWPISANWPLDRGWCARERRHLDPSKPVSLPCGPSEGGHTGNRSFARRKNKPGFRGFRRLVALCQTRSRGVERPTRDYRRSTGFPSAIRTRSSGRSMRSCRQGGRAKYTPRGQH